MDNVTATEVVAPRQAVAPRAINHVVLNVRDIEESHRFWTEMIGFKRVGTAKPRPDRPNPSNFRFYSCDHEAGDSAIMTWPWWKTPTCRRRPRNGT
jgi:catechol 2,3-dioxygenase-like lactoylglutathione lyase family enzyme